MQLQLPQPAQIPEAAADGLARNLRGRTELARSGLHLCSRRTDPETGKKQSIPKVD